MTEALSHDGDLRRAWLYVSSRLGAIGAVGALGWVMGAAWDNALVMALCAALATASLLTILDAIKGNRLLEWLRAPEATPPVLGGLLGDVAGGLLRNLRLSSQALDEERSRMQQLLSGIQASPNGLILLDAALRITWINNVAARQFELDPEKDIGQHVTNLIRVPAFVQLMQAGEPGASVKCNLPNKGVVQAQVHAYGAGLKLILSQDITERERADTMRRDFVANVSHEIRTPLTVLHGFIETLDNLPLTEVERKRVISLMAQQTARMKDLVSNLLTLAKIEGGVKPGDESWHGVQTLMDRLESEARALSCGRHPLKFAVDQAHQPEGTAEVFGVETEWFSAMSNLVSNAVRYTPDGGTIEVRWHALPDGRGEFRVRDEGSGIDAQHIPRLTERFYRVDSSRSRVTGGTGLGLSIVKHVVQRHGCELNITSEVGKGSTFTISVPASRIKTRQQVSA